MKKQTMTISAQKASTVFILMLVCLSVLTVQASAAVRQNMGDLPIEGSYAISASIGHDRVEYHGRMSGGHIEAENTGNHFTARFGQAGVEIVAGMKGFSVQPVAWGYGDELALLPEGMPHAVDNMVVSRRSGLTEWYVNGPLGLQQGFTVRQAPQAGRGPLTIAMALVGAEAGAVDADGRGVMLAKLDGGAQYRYSGLVVRDAGGREAEAWLEAKAGMLKICVDDTGLTYPLYIDPVIQMAKLTAADGASSDVFGCSVAVSGDTVLVGARQDDDMRGAAYLFLKPAGGWADMTQIAKLTAADSAQGDGFGNSVAVSGDTVVVGANQDDGSRGSAYVFVKPAGGWANMTQTAKLTASDGAGVDFFGFSVAVSRDTVVVGAYQDDDVRGTAYVFVKPAGGWADMTQTAKLTASDRMAQDSFGMSVGVSGDTVIVGAPYHRNGAFINQGEAYIFVKPETGWRTMTETARLTSSEDAPNNYFGFSVAIDGATAVVGAPYDDVSGNFNQGSAYVFLKPAGGWADMTQTALLTASDGEHDDNLGNAIAVSGDTVVVGANQDDFSRGSSYVFVKPAGGWADMTQAAKLTASDGAAGDEFGNSVAVSGITVVAGARLQKVGTNIAQGSAYVFTFFAEEPTLPATDVTFSAIRAGSMTLSWTPGNGSGSIVLMKQDSAVNGTPVDGLTYTPGSKFGSGEQIGTGNYVVYAGSGSSVTVTGLRPSNTYYVAVYEFNNVPRFQAENYLTINPATGSQGVKLCPAVKLYGEGSVEVELLRRYRDEVLEQTAAGTVVVNLYYKLAPMAEIMMDNNPYLRQTAKRIIDKMLPSIKQLLER